MSLRDAQRFVVARDPNTRHYFVRDGGRRVSPLAAQWWSTPEEAREEVPDFYELHWIEWTAAKIEEDRDA